MEMHPIPQAREHVGRIADCGRSVSGSTPELAGDVRFATRSDQKRTDAMCRVSRVSPVQTVVRNCTRDEGGPFEAGSQVLASNRCKLLSSKAMVVSVAVNVGT